MERACQSHDAHPATMIAASDLRGRFRGARKLDIEAHNRGAWDQKVEHRNRWTLPVSPGHIAAARRGEWGVVLTPSKTVPRHWFGDIAGCRILCLASGGGQQGPVLAAAGAEVTVLDNSPSQLEQDRRVAEREALDLVLELGTMTDLSRFADTSFDLVFHPVSNVFVPAIRPIWKEAFRVLRGSGQLLAGITNPIVYLFDYQQLCRGNLVVRHSLPYSDLDSLSAKELSQHLASNHPLEFGHTLEDQIGGQTDAGFVITGFFEDVDPEDLLGKFAPTFIATRARKPDAAVQAT